MLERLQNEWHLIPDEEDPDKPDEEHPDYFDWWLERKDFNLWQAELKYKVWERDHPPPRGAKKKFLYGCPDLPPLRKSPPRRSLRLNPELALEQLEGPITRKRRWDAVQGRGSATGAKNA